MKNILFSFIILLFIMSCNEKTNKNNNIAMNNKCLKENINISSSFIDDIDLKNFKYKEGYIEDIRIYQILDASYRKDFFDFLGSRDFEKGEYEQVFFIKILLTYIQQNNDIEFYNVLNELFTNKKLGYFLEDYELYIYELFLYKPSFFIQGAYLSKNYELLDYINESLPLAFLISNDEIDINLCRNCSEINLFIDKNTVGQIKLKELKKTIYQQPLIKITNRKNKDSICCYNIYKYLNSKSIESLSKNEKLFYEEKYNPFFKKYNIYLKNIKQK